MRIEQGNNVMSRVKYIITPAYACGTIRSKIPPSLDHLKTLFPPHRTYIRHKRSEPRFLQRRKRHYLKEKSKRREYFTTTSAVRHRKDEWGERLLHCAASRRNLCAITLPKGPLARPHLSISHVHVSLPPPKTARTLFAALMKSNNDLLTHRFISMWSRHSMPYPEWSRSDYTHVLTFVAG